MRAVAGVLLLVAVVLRAWHLGHWPGVNGDEAFIGMQARQWLAGAPGEWLTASGNLPDPFYLPLSLLAEWWFGPSFVALRLPALLSGVALPAAAYLLFRRRLGKGEALSLALLSAALPVHLAYSRLGWYPAQIPLAAAAILFFSLRQRLWPALLCLLLALTVHPTLLFLAPLAVAPYVIRRFEEASPDRWRLLFYLAAAGTACLLLSYLAGTAWLRHTGWHYHFRPWRFFTAGELYRFLRGGLELMNGISSYTYLAGQPARLTTWLHLGTTAVLAAGALLLGLRRCWRYGASWERGLLLGLAASLLSLFLTLGSFPLRPGVERYALFLTVPLTLVLLLLLKHALERLCRRPWLEPLAAGLSLLLLASFSWQFLAPLARHGGRGEIAFRTGKSEPKAAALGAILADAAARPATVIAEDWWSYWPIHYLAQGQPQLTVRQLDPQRRAVLVPPGPVPLYVVGFTGGFFSGIFGLDPRVKKIASCGDPAGQEILTVWKLERP